MGNFELVRDAIVQESNQGGSDTLLSTSNGDTSNLNLVSLVSDGLDKSSTTAAEKVAGGHEELIFEDVLQNNFKELDKSGNGKLSFWELRVAERYQRDPVVHEAALIAREHYRYMRSVSNDHFMFERGISHTDLNELRARRLEISALRPSQFGEIPDSEVNTANVVWMSFVSKSIHAAAKGSHVSPGMEAFGDLTLLGAVAGAVGFGGYLLYGNLRGIDGDYNSLRGRLNGSNLLK